MSAGITGEDFDDFYLSDRKEIVKKKGFWKGPFGPDGVVFGFIFRFLVCIIAVFSSLALSLFFGFLNNWQFNKAIMYIMAGNVFLVVLLGEYLRSHVYERVNCIHRNEHIRKPANAGISENVLTQKPAGTGFQKFSSQNSRWLYIECKNIFDPIIAFSALLLLSSLFALVGILIKLEDGGPVLEFERRYDINGRSFKAYRFRTMTRDRTRFTRIGGYLHITSISLLPMFINVLIGDINIVGPRYFPFRISKSELKIDTGEKIKSGLVSYAGLMSLHGDGPDTIETDIWYIKNRSFSLDYAILIRTIVTNLAKSTF